MNQIHTIYKRLSTGVLLFAIAALAGCRTARPVATLPVTVPKADTLPVTPPDPTLPPDGVPSVPDSLVILDSLYKQVMLSAYQFTTFSGKAKVDFTDPEGKSQNATAQVRIARDSIIWISLTGTLGIEGIRAIIRPDSIFLMDKIEKTISYRSVAWVQETTGLPFGFTDVQNLLVGNPVYFTPPLRSYAGTAAQVELLSTNDFFRHVLTFDTQKKVVVHSQISDVDTNSKRASSIVYDDYIPLQGNFFSNKRNITVIDKNTLNIFLDYKQVAFDEALSFPFNIPRSYKVK